MILQNDLFDTILVTAGVVLVITGLVMFIRSKTSTQASSVEAFGIKLNVTHPSLILVLAGVGLMLAPRLLPEPADRTAPAVIAETGTPQAPASRLPGPAATPVPPAAAPSVTSPVASLAKPSPSAPAIPKNPHARMASGQAAAKPASASPARVPPTSMETATASPAAAQPARPTLVYAALGLPGNRSFWNGETRTSYTRRMHAVLQQDGHEVLRMNSRSLDLGQTEFDAWWNESEQRPRSRELCAASPAPRALLSARVETPATFSAIESAYWPELRLRLFVCGSQHLYRQQKTLSPQNGDAWPFATELNSEIERFLRAYRGDLAD